MSHGAGLVRTTCSSGGGGPGAGAGQPGARPSEGLLDPVYPRTYSALLKVAQMVSRAPGFSQPPLCGPGPLSDRSHRQKWVSSSFLFSGPRRFEPEPGVEESPRRRAEAAEPGLLPLEAASLLPTQRAGLPCSGRSFAEGKSEVLSSLLGKRDGDPGGQLSWTPALSSAREGPGPRGPLERRGSMRKVRFEETVP
ncbi:CKLF-like MARVEL transmembrane domain-containing protein 7 isoform X2 [Mirounga leonina]|uniref:CKLF-like MARVEL transmembrane domain-containing protein 7 isoform X2 n=1 Tax=Mirounga leonina TaxID=9715 RepID=UPI00156C0935|nr:CKLF-like MARVEL transmembrane domain-containing protein 7 isoform X2 [Mirounga leonina]